MDVNGDFVMCSGIFDEPEFTACQHFERAEVQHALNYVWESGGTGPLILSFAIRWRPMVRVTLWPLYARELNPCIH